MKTIVALLLVLLLAGMAGSITPPGGSGDIEGVTVGAWLTGGGTSGSITITGDSATIMTYIRARFLELTDVDGTTIELDGSNLLTVDTTSAKLAEMIQDRIGEMLSGNTETNVTVTYDDATNKVNFSVSLAVADSAQNVDTTAATAVALGEMIADRVGAMLAGNTETNITVTYDDADNTIDFVVTGGAGWNWADSSSHGPDSVLFADSSNHSDRATLADSTSGGAARAQVATTVNPDSIQTKVVKSDTTRPLNGGGLNWEGGAGGLKAHVNGTVRFSFMYDTLFGHGNIQKGFQSTEADTVKANTVVVTPKIKADTTEGADPTAPSEFLTGGQIHDKFIKVEDEGWIGSDSTGANIRVESNGAGFTDDYLELHGAAVTIGDWPGSTTLHGLYMTHTFAGNIECEMSNLDSGNTSSMLGYLNTKCKEDGSAGGDVGWQYDISPASGSFSAHYSAAIDRSDSFKWKFNHNSGVGTASNGYELDTLGRMVFKGPTYMQAIDPDSMPATLGFGRKTEYIGVHGGMIRWTPEPNKTVAKFMTIPWVDTTGTYTRLDSMVSRQYLWRVTDTTASDDTLFTSAEWTVDAACSLFTMVYVGKTSSATASTSSLDSVIIYRNGSRITGGSIKPAFASTVLDTITVDFTDLAVNTGDLISVVWSYVLGNDAYADCKQTAFTRRKR
jgi:hypothetical protein